MCAVRSAFPTPLEPRPLTVSIHTVCVILSPLPLSLLYHYLSSPFQYSYSFCIRNTIPKSVIHYRIVKLLCSLDMKSLRFICQDTCCITVQYHGPSREANSHSASQEILRLLCNLEGSLPYSQDSVTGRYHEPDASNPHISPYLPKIYSNIFPSAPRASEWSLPFRFSD
jgi:hypothetical protein